MRKAENVNAPFIGGWLIGVAAGVVAFGVLMVVSKFDLTPAVAIGGVVALLVGLVLGMPWGANGAAEAGTSADGQTDAATADAVPEAAPAAFVSASPAVPADAAPAARTSGTKPKADAKPKAAAAPKAAAKPAAAAQPTVARPAGPERLSAPRNGKADDLKEIEGIGPAMEKLLNAMGFHHFDQIAGWSDADVALVDSEMKNFKGRITRDKWVAQARIIVSEGLEAFRIRAKANNY